MRSTAVVLTAILLGVLPAVAQERPPIIDMHLHAHEAWIPTAEDSTWIPLDLRMPDSDEALMRESLAALRELNVVRAVTSGDPTVVSRWRAAAPERIIPAIKLSDLPQDPSFLADLRARVEAGEIAVLGELQPQYMGYGPDDERFEAYFALADELDIPLAIHLGPGPRGGAGTCCPSYRVRAGDPLLLEEVLTRYPQVRVYVMHAGWPLLDNMVALLHSYPNVYVDLGVIDWYIPTAEFHGYLRRLVDAGFADRIMFGSDQMNWPGAIARAVEGVESAAFLTEEQKRAIFYDNAARFLRLDAAEGSAPTGH